MNSIMRSAVKALDDEDAGTVRASHVLEVRFPKQDLLDLFDTAGYGIGYWARKATVDEAAGTYRVWMQDPTEVEGVEGNRTITLDWIARMIVRVAAGDASLRGVAVNGQTAMACRRYVGSVLMGEPDADFDAFDADVLVQLCYFRGEVVYG